MRGNMKFGGGKDGKGRSQGYMCAYHGLHSEQLIHNDELHGDEGWRAHAAPNC